MKILTIIAQIEGVDVEIMVEGTFYPGRAQTYYEPEEYPEFTVTNLKMLAEPYLNVNWLYYNSDQWSEHVDEQIMEAINSEPACDDGFDDYYMELRK